jgi:hypothetical protein
MSAKDDLLFLGARLTPTVALLEVLLGPLPPGRAGELGDVLRLRGAALAASLELDPDGPLLLAALELGRRSALPLPGRGAEVRGPAEAAALASRVWTRTEPGPTALVLDDGGALARVRAFRATREALVTAIGAGGAGLAVVAPTRWPIEEAWAIAGGCDAVGLRFVDCVWSGEQGLISAARTGAVPVEGWATSSPS